MPKYRVNVEEHYNYLILVEADDQDKAEEIALETVGDGGIDFADGTTEVYETALISDDVEGPFPRVENDLWRTTTPIE